MVIFLHQLEGKLQAPCVTATAKDGSIDSTTAYEGGMITFDLDVHLLMLG